MIHFFLPDFYQIGVPPILLCISAVLFLVCGIIECVDLWKLRSACIKPSQPETLPQMQLQQRANYVLAPTVMVSEQTNVVDGAAEFCPG